MQITTSLLHLVSSVNCTRSMLWTAESHDEQKAFTIRIPNKIRMPIPLATRSTAWVCGRSFVGIVGSNPAGGMDACLCECCVLSGRGRWVGLITRPEESYRVWCVRVWSWILDNEVLAHWGLSRIGKNNIKVRAEWPNRARKGGLGTYRN
jgi:hypothetical protein